MHMDPAKTIISKIGGPEIVAKVTGRDLSRVYRWMYPKARGGSDGVIPHREARKLLAHAVLNGIDVTPADFFSPEDHPGS